MREGVYWFVAEGVQLQMLIPVLLLVAVVVVTVGGVLRWSRVQTVERACTAVYAVLLVWVAVLPFALLPSWAEWAHHQEARWSVVPLASLAKLVGKGELDIVIRQVLLNVLLFVPAGVMIPVLNRRVRTWPAILWRAFALGLAFEGLQLLVRVTSGLTYKTIDIDNVLLGVVGVCLGFLAFRMTSQIAPGSVVERPGV